MRPNLRLRELVAIGAVLGMPGLQVPAADTAERQLITRISELAEPLQSKVRRFLPLQLTGAVYGVDQTHRGLAIKDETGWLWLESEKLPDGLTAGNTIQVEGTAAVGNGHVILGRTTLIEGDSFKDLSKHAGQIRLSKGKHEFELDFYQGTGRAVLDVSCEGPGWPRGKIPPRALWHRDPNEPEHFLPGAVCDYYERMRSEFPDFRTLRPKASGITNSFTPRLAFKGMKANHYLLRFTGCLEVPADGVYEFTVLADDGARLALPFDAARKIVVAGSATLDPPSELRPGQDWGQLADPCWVRTEGTVRQFGADDGRLHLEIAAGTGRMEVTICDGDPGARALLLNSRIQATGLGRSAAGISGDKIAGRLLVPSMCQVTLVEASEASWRNSPTGAIAQIHRTKNTSIAEIPAHIAGTAVAVEPGRSLVLSDGAGRAEVPTPLARAEQKGAVLEAMGLAARDGTNMILNLAVCRPVAKLDGHGGFNAAPIATIEEVRQLAPVEAAQHRPVQFRGVVTYVLSDGYRATVQGESESVFVACVETNWQTLRTGERCEFEGRTEATPFFPTVIYDKFTALGPGKLPEPLRPVWAQLANGSLDSQWVEVQGGVLKAAHGEMTLALHGGELQVRVAHGSDADLAPFANALVHVRGVVSLVVKRGQIEGATLQVSSPLDITMDTPALANPFLAPTCRVADLIGFDRNATTVQFLKVAGQITHVQGATFYLLDETNGLRFTARDKIKLNAGDQVEVVGIPENEGHLPTLRQALVRVAGHAPLPSPLRFSSADLGTSLRESALVQMEAKVLNVTTNAAEQDIELQIGTRSILARLDRRAGLLGEVPAESYVRVTGVYTCQPTSGIRNSLFASELLMNSPADVVVLRSPPWWNLRHSLLVLGAMSLTLAGALSWITALRARVDRRTRELRDEIAEHRRTEASLHEQTRRLRAEVEERKLAQLEVERVHRQLVDASREAGQAEVAASVLHNVGNVLNSVNISASVIAERVRDLRLTNLSKAADLMKEHGGELGRFLTEDEKGRRLPQYLGQLAGHLGAAQKDLLKELQGLTQNVEHIKEIVSMQQSYARRFGVSESITPADLVETALKLQAASYRRHSIEVVRQYEAVAPVTVDKHKVLQILVNLLQNARHACDEGSPAEKKIIVRIRRQGEEGVRVEVEDNGIGIPSENMMRIFRHGFTTRKDGHGFGLHSAALAAGELGGSLKAHSDGIGKGALFTLELPLSAAAVRRVTNAIPEGSMAADPSAAEDAASS